MTPSLPTLTCCSFPPRPRRRPTVVLDLGRSRSRRGDSRPRTRRGAARLPRATLLAFFAGAGGAALAGALSAASGVVLGIFAAVFAGKMAVVAMLLESRAR